MILSHPFVSIMGGWPPQVAPVEEEEGHIHHGGEGGRGGKGKEEEEEEEGEGDLYHVVAHGPGELHVGQEPAVVPRAQAHLDQPLPGGVNLV